MLSCFFRNILRNPMLLEEIVMVSLGPYTEENLPIAFLFLYCFKIKQFFFENITFTFLFFSSFSMPWMRPALKRWISTMFEIVSIMRNHSWQNYTRHYFPLLVNYTTRPITMNIYLMAWFLRNFPSNTTVTNETMISTLTYPLFLRLNYTQFFLNVTNAYMNLTAKTLNFTRNMTELFLNR